ncbi:MAG: hypothetical protein AB1582_21425 [Pseudomonadota bacterium]
MSFPVDDPSREGDQPMPQLQPLSSSEDHGSLLQRLPDSLAGRVGMCLVAAALLGVGAWSTGLWPDGNSPRIAVVTQQAGPQAIGGSVIMPVAKADWEKAIDQLMTSDVDKRKVRSGLENGSLRLGTVTVSDFDAEDGDWVSITGAGVKQDVRLFKKPLTVTIPYLPGGTVSVLGLVDGGGGDITVSIHVGAAAMPLRALKPGEAVQIPTP